MDATATDAPVVVGVAPHTEPCYLLRWAAEEALRRGTTLRLVYAFEPVPAYTAAGLPSPVTLDDPYHAARSAHARLSRLTSWLHGRYPGLAVSGTAQAGSPLTVLGGQAATAGLLVVGRRERGRIVEALLGSTAVDVLDVTVRPVVAVPDRIGPVPAGAPVVLGVKAGPPAEQAAWFALGAAARSGVPLRVVHYWQPGRVADHAAVAAAAVAAARAGHPGVPVELSTAQGDAAELLVRDSRSASLLVLGPGSSGRLPRRLGRVGGAVLRGAACPVAFAPTVPTRVRVGASDGR
jgi:nucleotide-binding universal stress UspA family protein